ncbi:MAG: TRAP transporter large permease subunit [Deltaproteobacteria bacterium]|nr:TRAP transporter large permease subunit [Deltaproteobacteria bacterium]
MNIKQAKSLGVTGMISSWATRLRMVIERLSNWCTMVGGVTLLGMMFLIVAEVALRSLVKMPIPGTIEMVQMMLIIVLFSGMGAIALRKEHIRVDILIDKFPSQARLIVTICADLVTLGIVAIIAWQSFVQSHYLRSSAYITGLLRLPTWPFAAATGLFVVIFSLGILVNLLDAYKELADGGKRKCLWLIPGLIIVLLLYVTGFWPEILPISIGFESFGVLSLLLLGVLIFLGVHIGAAMALVAFWGMAHLVAPNAGLSLIGMTSQSVASNYIWSVGPLFMLMGLLVANAGFSKDVYGTAYKWLGRTPGGLASATISACGAFAAVVGDSLTAVVTIGTIGLPQMRTYKYDVKLATGAICAGGTIGILIPPSLGFIIYGIIVEESIGKLFIAGIIPGIILTALMVVLVYFRCRINPALGPRGPVTPFRKKLVSLKNSFGVVFLFLLVIGGIYSGIFTPTEAGAIGAFGALVVGMAARRFSFRAFGEAVTGAIGLAAMVFFIFIYAMAITQFLAVTQLPVLLADYVAGLETPRYLTLCIILFSYLILGCDMNALPVVILTLPIIYPTVMALGFDPIWFGVLLVMMVEIGQITPPIGMSVFAMSGVAPDVPMYTIFRGVFPFWLVMLSVVILVMIFPQIALFLPNLMMGH